MGHHHYVPASVRLAPKGPWKLCGSALFCRLGRSLTRASVGSTGSSVRSRRLQVPMHQIRGSPPDCVFLALAVLQLPGPCALWPVDDQNATRSRRPCALQDTTSHDLQGSWIRAWPSPPLHRLCTMCRLPFPAWNDRLATEGDVRAAQKKVTTYS